MICQICKKDTETLPKSLFSNTHQNCRNRFWHYISNQKSILNPWKPPEIVKKKSLREVFLHQELFV